MSRLESCRCGSVFQEGGVCPTPGCRRKPFASRNRNNPPGGGAPEGGHHGSAWRSTEATKRKRAFLALPQNRECWECGGVATVVDHIIPVSTPEGKRRLMDPGNWRPHCRPCSNRQGAKLGAATAAANRRRRKDPGSGTP